jgi:hypothetical protein
MTIQDLKNNREVIIETITNTYGESMVKDIMSFMASSLENSVSDTIEDFIAEIFEMVEFKMRSKKDSKLVQMTANYELENSIKYDVVKKEYVSI